MAIRQINPTQGLQFYQLMKQLDQETAYMLYLPDERTYDEKRQSDSIAAINQNGTVIGLFEEEQLIGTIVVSRSPLAKVHHTGYLVIGLLRAYCGKGLGGKLMDAAINWAQKNQLHRLELTVVTENQPAVALYKKKRLYH